MLQAQGETELSQKAKQFVENLAKQSEVNKKMLMDHMELQNLMKTQSGISDEKSLMTDIDMLIRQHQNTSAMEQQLSVHTPQQEAKNTKNTTSDASGKKEFAASPDTRFAKKKKTFGKPKLEIDINTVNEEHNEAGKTTKLFLDFIFFFYILLKTKRRFAFIS